MPINNSAFYFFAPLSHRLYKEQKRISICRATMMFTHHSHAYLALNRSRMLKTGFSKNSCKIHKKEGNHRRYLYSVWKKSNIANIRKYTYTESPLRCSHERKTNRHRSHPHVYIMSSNYIAGNRSNQVFMS
jgi:hypothetical protein